jgi:hypothetical protein
MHGVSFCSADFAGWVNHHSAKRAAIAARTIAASVLTMVKRAG